MSTSVRSYAAHSPTGRLGLFQFDRRSPRPDDVVIEVLYCGVCHSDLHTVRNDWGGSKYPIVPGHEIIGRVVAVGAEVSRFQAGERVGVGCMVASCRHCGSCGKGWEQYCESGATYTYNSKDPIDGSATQGGYSEQIVVAQDFVLKVPESLDPAAAAPLLCAGITTWSPLRHWQVGQGSRVAIVGLGGLGHMGLKLAKALGAEVTLFSRSPGKEADARRLGADRIVISTDEAQMASVAGRFDLIIDTVPMVRSRKALAGSLIGGIAETQEMLDFCGQHGITSDIELVRIQDINEAYERLLKADVKYRFVIDMASLKDKDKDAA